MSVVSPLSERDRQPLVETAGDERRSGWDRAKAAVTSGNALGTNGTLAYGLIAAVVLAFCLVNAFSAADDALRHGGAYRLDLPLFYEATSALAALLALPLMRHGVASVRAGRNWPTRAARAALLAALFAAVHILGMVALRKLGCWAAGSSYVFAPTEIPYEIRKDLVSALLIGMAFWVTDRPQRAAGPDAVLPGGPAVAPNPVLWLRDGASRVRIDAREVVWVASAGNYVEYAMTSGRHLIRGTLAGEEARLSAFGVVRVHRTRLVNLAHAVLLEPRPSGDFAIRMTTGEIVSGSRRYRSAVATLRCSEPSGGGAPAS